MRKKITRREILALAGVSAVATGAVGDASVPGQKDDAMETLPGRMQNGVYYHDATPPFPVLTPVSDTNEVMLSPGAIRVFTREELFGTEVDTGRHRKKLFQSRENSPEEGKTR